MPVGIVLMEIEGEALDFREFMAEDGRDAGLPGADGGFVGRFVGGKVSDHNVLILIVIDIPVADFYTVCGGAGDGGAEAGRAYCKEAEGTGLRPVVVDGGIAPAFLSAYEGYLGGVYIELGIIAVFSPGLAVGEVPGPGEELVGGVVGFCLGGRAVLDDLPAYGHGLRFPLLDLGAAEKEGKGEGAIYVCFKSHCRVCFHWNPSGRSGPGRVEGLDFK